MEIGFTARQVVKLTGIPYSTLNLWAKNGLVRPSVASGTGTGSERVYSFNDLVALKVAFELRQSGVATPSIKKVVEFLNQHEHMEKPPSEARLVVSGRDVAMVRKGELVSVLSKPGQGYLSFVVDLPELVRGIFNAAESAKAFAHAIASEAPTENARKKPKGTLGSTHKTRIRA